MYEVELTAAAQADLASLSKPVAQGSLFREGVLCTLGLALGEVSAGAAEAGGVGLS